MSKVKKIDIQNQEELPVTESPASPPIACGYLVAKDKNGKLVFQPEGNDLGVIELLGLHSFATMKIHQLVEQKTGLGIAQVTQLVQGLAHSSQNRNKL